MYGKRFGVLYDCESGCVVADGHRMYRQIGGLKLWKIASRMGGRENPPEWGGPDGLVCETGTS
ncbi:MAG: hypothetical protein CMJ68_05420 [Planctomycetaceae bacterium]|nr:hypothetical protein [Planctomycetaceae bacterium]